MKPIKSMLSMLAVAALPLLLSAPAVAESADPGVTVVQKNKTFEPFPHDGDRDLTKVTATIPKNLASAHWEVRAQSKVRSWMDATYTSATRQAYYQWAGDDSTTGSELAWPGTYHIHGRLTAVDGTVYHLVVDVKVVP